MSSVKISENWRKRINEWIFSGRQGVPYITDVLDDVIAPLLLRERHAAPHPLAVIAPDAGMAENIVAQLQSWAANFDCDEILYYLPDTVSEKFYLPANEATRARVLHRVLTEKFDIVVGSVSSFISQAPQPDMVVEREMIITPNSQITFAELLEKLVEMDYDDEFEVEVQGEFSRRGGIIDVFSPAHDFPVRIEFWGDEIDSMREFSPDTQRSVRQIDEYHIISRSSIIEDGENTGIDFFDYLERFSGRLLVVFPERCREHLERFKENYHVNRFRDILNKLNSTICMLDSAESAEYSTGSPGGCFPAAAHLNKALPGETQDGGFELLRQLTAQQIKQWLEFDYRIVLLGKDQNASGHIAKWCEMFEIDPERIVIDTADMSEGVIFPDMKLVFLTEKELFTAGMFKKRAFTPQTREVSVSFEEAAAIADLDEDDYAVHLVHGIGIFKGIREVETRGVAREVMVLEYRDNAMLYVPVWQAGLVSRYIGSKKGNVVLNRLGGRKWSKIKLDAVKSIRDFAIDMLKIQALRESKVGIAFGDDSLDQRIFEDSFPYTDTPDQTRAASEIKKDMSGQHPMDRLLCGDVGYGKTEVAIRAAFKAVMAGKQVAVLVPTTILAQQHYYSFCERFAEYPVVVEMLSRFKSPSAQVGIIHRLHKGAVDIVIGTHRILQPDVMFSDLGLVVIDEEQRFGVKHKEELKRFRTTVDILTMTATPIPRTLYMAMTGVRDLSTIVTAPGLRLPVQTIVTQYDENVIVNAISREVARKGQVFFVHNRVKSIDRAADHLRELMPHVKFAVAHGRMNEVELENVMANFLTGNCDVLVCTTIIESGVDIPNANTIIIDRADRFGLAELYQLRGRVGRWNRQAYAYLLLPKSNIITSDARKRIAAIRRYTHLGAGFKLALRDLEIRGAGNLIGAEQSGHINNIGFDLYCQLLRSTVAQLQGKEDTVLPTVEVSIEFVNFAHKAPEEHLAAGFPPEYIPSERLRIDAYRRLALLVSVEELETFIDELEDRYGRLPEQGQNMAKITEIRIHAARAGYQSVSVRNSKVIIEGRRGVFKLNGKLPVISPLNIPKFRLDNLVEIARLIK